MAAMVHEQVSLDNVALVVTLKSASRRDQEQEVSWTLTKKLDTFAGPGERSRGEMWCWTLKLAQKRPRTRKWSWA